jgi:hypothetical protein
MPTSPTDAILATLDADRAALWAAVESVPVALRGRRPAADAWSVADVLEHLALVEERSVAVVTDLAAGAPPRDDDAAPALHPTEDTHRATLADRTHRVEAPPTLHPSGQVDAAAAAERLARSRAALRAVLAAHADRDLAATERAHPRLGPLTGEQWVLALGGHEARHAAQIREIGAQLAAVDADPASAGT